MSEKKFSQDRFEASKKASKFSERGKRISKIREVFCGGDNTKFAEILGTSTTFTSGICNGQKNAGEKLLDSIIEAFPQVNEVWLYFGKGAMTLDGSVPNPAVEQPVEDTAPSSARQVEKEDIRRLIQTVATLTEANNKQTEQIGKLIELLANN